MEKLCPSSDRLHLLRIRDVDTDPKNVETQLPSNFLQPLQVHKRSAMPLMVPLIYTSNVFSLSLAHSQVSMHNISCRPLRYSYLLWGINYTLIHFQNAVLIDCLLQYRKLKYALPIDRIIERPTA